MKRVLLGSMPVGGGHNALRDSFLGVLQQADPAGRLFEPISFTSADTRVSGFYEACVHHAPWFNDVVWDMSKTAWGVRLGVLTNSPLYEEALRTLEQYRPQVVLSAHFLLSMMFARARRKLGLQTTVINAIPDYGAPTLAFYPSAPDLQADYTIVMDRAPLRTLVESFGAPVSRLHLSGFVPRQPFVEVGRRLGDSPRLQPEVKHGLVERLKAQHPELAGHDPRRPTLIFLGGSAWTEKTMPVIEQLLGNPEFARHLNAIVISGKNQSFQQALSARVAHLPGFSVFGFVSAAQLAELMAISDVPVLGSLAPASLHELLETRLGPLMLFHYIPGSENAHGEWIRRHELGLYEPDPYQMTELLMQATGFKRAGAEISRLMEHFPARARELREDHLTRAMELPNFLARVGQEVPASAPVVPKPASWEPSQEASAGGIPRR